MAEIWRDVINYEGLYQVSNRGRVKSLERIVHRSSKKRGEKQSVGVKILKQNHVGRDNLMVRLCKNATELDFLVHRLVATAFIPNPNNLPEVNHKDGYRRNNHLKNLEWMTHLDNIRHARKNCLYPTRLKETSVRIIKRLLEIGEQSQREIAEEFGVAQQAISNINCGATWSWLFEVFSNAKK